VTGPIAAEVAGEPVQVAEVDGREAGLRASPGAAALPARGTSEGRQLRRWLTQLLVAERLVTIEAARRGITDRSAPGPLDILPDATARAEIGSLAAALLDTMPLARALFADLTADVRVPEEDVGDYYARNGHRFAEPPRRDAAGWRVFDPDRRTNGEPADRPQGRFIPLPRVWSLIEAELRGAAGRQKFARWLDAARADLVQLRPGFEHPGDPGQPDNTHRH
jgi:[acyl-carrier-protein] S-malonyltransferase